MDDKSRTKIFRCESCGAAFRDFPAGRTAVCTHCGHVEKLKGRSAKRWWSFRRSMGQYRETALEAEASLADAREEELLREKQERQERKPAFWITFTIALSAVTYVLMGMLGVRPLERWFAAFFALIVGSFMLYAAIRRPGLRRKKDQEQPADQDRISGTSVYECPGCGAYNHLVPGIVPERCGSCGAALFHSSRTMRESLDAFAAGTWRSTLNFHRHERHRRGRPAGTRSIVRLLWPTLPVMFTMGLSLNDMLSGPVIQYKIIVPLAVFAACIMANIAVPLVFLRKRRKLRSSLESAGSRYGGAVLKLPDGLTDWLDRCWAGSSYRFDDLPGSVRSAISMRADGFEAAVITAFLTFERREYPSVYILVAAGNTLQDNRQKRHREAKIEQAATDAELLGYDLELGYAGVVLQGREETVRRLSRNPGMVETELPKILDVVLGLLMSLGAIPVP